MRGRGLIGPSVVILSGLIFLVGCAREVRTRGGDTEPEPGEVSPEDPSATATPTEKSPMGEPVEVTPGKVVVEPSKTDYREGEDLVVTISNGLSRSIFTEDSKTACTVFTLERRSGGTWEEVSGCAVERAPLVVELGPGKGRTERISPSSPHFGDQSGGPAFGSGTYRFSFSYRLERDPGGETLSVVSKSFVIR